jgi:hypothetical protein
MTRIGPSLLEVPADGVQPIGECGREFAESEWRSQDSSVMGVSKINRRITSSFLNSNHLSSLPFKIPWLEAGVRLWRIVYDDAKGAALPQELAKGAVFVLFPAPSRGRLALSRDKSVLNLETPSKNFREIQV